MEKVAGRCFVFLCVEKVRKRCGMGHSFDSRKVMVYFEVFSQAIPNLFTPGIITSTRCAPASNGDQAVRQ
jgi:hypothetical protein